MPLHEYLCGKCGKTSEILQAVGEKSATICPYCGGKLKKLISAPAIQFKGSGWYVTDYAKKGMASSPSEKADAGEKSSKSEETPKAADSAAASSKDSGGAAAKSEKPSGKPSGKKAKG